MINQNRTPQFRGYSKDTNAWIYGDGVFILDDKHTQIAKFVMGDTDSPIHTMHNVERHTVGNLIGNIDGNDIYEGDVLKVIDNVNKTYQYVLVERGGWFFYNLDNKGMTLLSISVKEEHFTIEKTQYDLVNMPEEFNLNQLFV